MTGPEVTADVSSAPSLGDEVSQMLGDYVDYGGESPGPDTTSAAGTTPVEPAAGTETETPQVATADGAETTSEGLTPDATLATTEEDLFKGTTPATFYVNGKPLTSEDIRVFKEGGAVIRAESLPNVLSKLAERETLSEQVRTVGQQYATLNKVSEWHDPSTNKTYTGPEAAIEMRIGNAALFAENELLMSEVIQSDDLQSLLTTRQVADGNGGVREVVIFRPEAIDNLRRENGLRQREAANAIRDHYKTVIAQASRPAPAPINYEAAAPELIAEIAKTANLDASVLTPADRKLLTEHLPEHTKDGLASLKWQSWVKDRIQERVANKASTQSIVSATEKATKEGQARMAAAARGVKPGLRPTTPVRTPQPDPRLQDQGNAYDQQERAAARALRMHAS